MPKIFQGYFRCVVRYQCHIFCPYCILHWAQSNSCSKSNAVCCQDNLFVCSAVLLECFLVLEVFYSFSSLQHTLSVALSYLVHRGKLYVLFNFQILYANEAESINPVEKDKEEQQTEVSKVIFLTPIIRAWKTTCRHNF